MISTKKPKISIIMGIYNCEATISECIDSILKQTYEDWELIMCDDCSRDKTYQIAKEYELRYPKKIKVIRNKENLKLAATLNNCLKLCNGEYIARMDADDICLPKRFEIQVRFLDNHLEYDVVGSRRIIFDDNGDLGIRGIYGESTKETMLKTVPFAHPTIMMRKSAYDKLGGYTVGNGLSRCEDLDLWFRFFYDGLRGYNLETPLLKYRESLNDYKKRKVKYGIETAKVLLRGYNLLGFTGIKKLRVIKPIISSILPNKLIRNWHNKKLKSTYGG